MHLQIDAELVTQRENIQQFEERKQAERETQELAFSIIQKAQRLAANQQFDQAADQYVEAISLLNSIGWQQQTIQLQVVLDQLKARQHQIEIKQQQTLQKQMEKTQEMQAMEEQIQAQLAAEKETMEQRRATSLELAKHSQKLNEAKEIAFALIDEAEQVRTARET